MPKTRGGILLPLLSAGIAFQLAAQGQTDSLHHDSASSAAVAPAPKRPAALTMPLAVRGYQLRDSVRLGSDAAGVQYMYTRNKTDDIAVFVAPYRPDDKLGSADERSDYVLSDVDAYYQTLELAARQGNLEGFRLLHRGSDDLHTHGHSVIAAAVWAIFARRGATRPVFTYYATYALPTEAIRIRAELPLITAGTEGVPEFARTLIASLAAQY